MKLRGASFVCAVVSLLIAACIPTVRDDGRFPTTPEPTPATPHALPPEGHRGGSLTVRFLDVGQGDAALLTTSDGHAMLIDSGPPDGAPKVMNELRKMGSSATGAITLDNVVLSHAHADHLGTLSQVVAEFPKAHFFESGFSEHPVAEYKRFHSALVQAHAEHAVRRGEHFALGSFTEVSVLAPSDPLIARTRSDVNSNSVVVRVDHHSTKGDIKFLFVGDAEHPTETRLLEHADEVATDVLKVAHHGSKHASSAAFLTAAHPKLAVVSCALGNDYGHPHGPTLKRLKGQGAAITRTDLQGDITVVSDDNGLKWSVQREVDPAQLTIPGTATKEREAP